MARPNSYGLNYFSIDTEMFMNRKIRRLLKAFGSKGFLIYMYILTEIYRDKGCFLLWDENTAFDVSDYLNISENVVNEVVAYCFDVGLFDKELHESEKILTSKNIQIRWEKISREAKRKICKVGDINKKYSLIQEETEFTPEETQNTQEETTQRKEKNNKEKEKNNEEKENIVVNPEIAEKLYQNQKRNLDEVFMEMDKNELWKEQMCMIHGIPGSTVQIKLINFQKLMNDFHKHLSVDHQVKQKSISDTYIHFSNWLKKRKQYES